MAFIVTYKKMSRSSVHYAPYFEEVKQMTRGRGYKVRIGVDRVWVEHRASFRPRTIRLLCIGYLAYYLLPGVRPNIFSALRSHDLAWIAFTFLLFQLPLVPLIGLFFFASGEVMRCDAEELRFARRRTFWPWRRFTLPAREIRELHFAFNLGGRARTFNALLFQHRGRTYYMLEDLDVASANQVLSTLSKMGIDAYTDTTQMPTYKLRLRSDLP